MSMASRAPGWFERRWRRSGVAGVGLGLLGALAVSGTAFAATAPSSPVPTSQVSQTLDGLVGQLVRTIQTMTSLMASAVSGNPPGFGGSWFGTSYASMALLGAMVALGALFVTVASATVGGRWQTLGSLFVRLPFVLLGIAAVPVVVHLLDEALGQIGAGFVSLAGHSPQSAAQAISTTAASLGAGSQPPLFNAIVLALTCLGSALYWAMEFVRSGVLYVAVSLVPLAASASLWPRGRVIFRRTAELVVGFILGQLPMALFFSLAAAVAGQGATVPSALANTSDDASKLFAVALLLVLGALSPVACVVAQPVARVEDALERRGGSEHASALDVSNAADQGYHQVLAERTGTEGVMTLGEPTVIGGWSPGGVREGGGGFAAAGVGGGGRGGRSSSDISVASWTGGRAQHGAPGRHVSSLDAVGDAEGRRPATFGPRPAPASGMALDGLGLPTDRAPALRRVVRPESASDDPGDTGQPGAPAHAAVRKDGRRPVREWFPRRGGEQ